MLVAHHADGTKALWSIDRLIYDVNRLTNDYFNKYGTKPNYIKLPFGLAAAIHSEYKEIISFEHTSLCFFCNLLVCETFSVTTPDEIEVF